MSNTAMPEEISPGQLAAAMPDGTITLLDCREPDEYAIARLPGARLLPLGDWSSVFPRGFPPADAAVVVYCHHGYRSLRAVRFLRQQGYASAQSLAGGIDAWSRLVDPTVARY